MAIQGFFTGDVKIRDLNGVLKAVDGIVEVATDAGTVTSVGLIVGSTGTDVNVANSPITSSGNITLNLPTASATNRGLLSSADWTTFNNKQAAGNYVTLDTYQTITASKTFSVGFNLASVGGTNQPTFFENTNNLHSGSVGSNIFGFNTNNNIYFGKGSDNGGVLSWNNSEVRYYTLPNANGTIALVGGSGVGTVTSIATTGPITGGTITSTGTIGITQATTSTDGYLSSTDWNTFNNKQGALTLTTTGSSGAATLVGTTLNIPNYGSVIGNYVPYTGATSDVNLGVYTLSANSLNVIGVSGAAGYLGLKQSLSVLYGGGGYTSLTGEDKVYLSMYFSQDSLGTNYKLARFNASALTNNTQRTYSLPDASGTIALTSDLTGYVTAVTASSPLFSSGGTTPNITIQQASGSQNGYLSSTDWTTFNNKQAAGNYITALTGEATASGPGSATVTLSTSAVTGKLLTGLNLTGGGTIAATDSILQAFGKVQNQISGMVGGVTFQGTWDASTNTPTLTSSFGTKGYYYIVDVAGSTNLNGITDWKVGDWAIFNGSTWDKVDNTDSVSSVNGFTGAVSLTTANISEVTNLYYLDSRARASISLTTTGTSGVATYDNTTGVFNIPNYGSALTGYVPYTGATANVDLGTFDLTADIINLNQLKAVGSGGLNIYSNSGTHIALMGGGGGAGTTFYGGIIGVSASFTSSGSSDTFGITHSSGSGIALNITKGGNGEGLYINKTSGSGNAATIIGTLNATTLVKSGGTSSEFLKADGSVDSSTYLTTSAASSTYLPLTGGTLTGVLSINSALRIKSGSATGVLLETYNTNQLVVRVTPSSTTYDSTLIFPSSSRNFTFPAASGTIALTSDIPSLSGYVQGSGTTNYLPKFTGASTIGNSIVQDNGSTVTIGGSLTLTASSGFPSVGLLNRSSDTTLYMVSPASGFTLTDSSLNTIYNATPTAHNWNISNSLKMKLDASGNLGLGVTPSAWGTGQKAIQFGSRGIISNNSAGTYSNFGNNGYFDGTNWVYLATGTAGILQMEGNNFYWQQAPSGTAGNAISFTQAMTLNASGNLSLGNTNDTYKLDVNGTGRFSNSLTVNNPSSWANINIVGSSSTQGGQVDFYGSTVRYGTIVGEYESAGNGKITLRTWTGSGTTPVSALVLASTGAATFSSSVTTGDYIRLPLDTYLQSSDGSGGWIELIKGSGINTVVNNNKNGAIIFNQSSGGGEKMRITSGGNVGIGTTSPNTLLSLVGGHVSGQSILKIQSGSSYSSGGLSSIGFNDSDGTRKAIVYTNSDGLQLETSSATPILFNTNSAERMRITSGGMVGIGTTGPSKTLEVSSDNGSTNTTTGLKITNWSNTNGARAGIVFQNYDNNGAAIWANRTGSTAGELVFGTNGGGSTAETNITERMRITSGGALLVGRTSVFSVFGDSIGTTIYSDATYIAASGSEALGLSRRTSDGNVAIFRRDTTTVGSISVTGSSTTYNTSSDYRLKQDLKDFNGLDLLTKIKTYDYEWKADKSRGYGVIAHELQSVINYAVTGVKDGKEMQGVDYSKIVPVLIKAIQELNDKIK